MDPPEPGLPVAPLGFDDEEAEKKPPSIDEEIGQD
jgi:hypothetical protein